MRPSRALLRVTCLLYLTVQLGCVGSQPRLQMPERFQLGVYQIISFSRDRETRVMRALLLLSPSGFGLEILGDFEMPLTLLSFDAKGLQIRDRAGAFPRPLAALIARDIFLTYYAGGVPLKAAFASRDLRNIRIQLNANPRLIEKSIDFSGGNRMRIELALDNGQINNVTLSSTTPSYQLRIRCLRQLSPRLDEME
ncbi:MAG: DUF3261 domain-containing protein [Deltaproteobacteria bacterium]|nr:DUF3261 domain-containing protein [Deltaproteobacteria bacterium]